MMPSAFPTEWMKWSKFDPSSEQFGKLKFSDQKIQIAWEILQEFRLEFEDFRIAAFS